MKLNLNPRIDSIMVDEVFTAEKTTPIKEAARIILKKRIGCLVVLHGNKPVGIITERNIVRYLAENSQYNEKTPIGKIMSRPIIMVKLSTSYSVAINILLSRGIKRLPVVKEGKVVGLLTLQGMLNYSRYFMWKTIEEIKALKQEINLDRLTGFYNKNYISLRIRGEFKRVTRYGGRSCLLFMDIDYFKRVNDTYSHTAGDRVLKEFAALLREKCRESDIIGRFGGEEFCIITPFLRSRQAAYFAEKIRKRIQKHSFKYKNNLIKITVTIGLTSFTGAASNQEVLERADEAMYAGKKYGRNTVCRWKNGKIDRPLVK